MVLKTANKHVQFDDEKFVDELEPGTKLLHKQYVIDSYLHSGGFGVTYVARDSLNRKVVIKECFPSSFCHRQGMTVQPRSRAHQAQLRGIVQLFAREALSLAKAEHPNIVRVHTVFEDNNTAYMAMDYVEGRDLLEIISDEPDRTSPSQIEAYLRKMLSAIGHIHRNGLLHRDVSPDNILINHSDEPILIDFGAAREQAGIIDKTLSALRVVKDGYSPQEFYVAGSSQSASCDLYSLAASFYHIITGELPPNAQYRLAALAANENDPYVPLAEKTTDFSPAFTHALDKAISLLPKDRVQSADEWVSLLDQSDQRVRKTNKTVTDESGFRKHWRWALSGGVGLVGAIIASLVFSGTEQENASVERAPTPKASTGLPTISVPELGFGVGVASRSPQLSPPQDGGNIFDLPAAETRPAKTVVPVHLGSTPEIDATISIAALKSSKRVSKKTTHTLSNPSVLAGPVVGLRKR